MWHPVLGIIGHQDYQVIIFHMQFEPVRRRPASEESSRYSRHAVKKCVRLKLTIFWTAANIEQLTAYVIVETSSGDK